MKTQFLVGQPWKTLFRNVACHRYHHRSCFVEHGNKQTFLNIPRKNTTTDAPANQNKKCSITGSANKAFTVYQNVDILSCNEQSCYEKHVPKGKGLANNPCGWKIFSAYQNVDMVGCRSYTTSGKHFSKEQLTQNSPSVCFTSKILPNVQNCVNLNFCESRFFCSSAMYYEPCYIFKYIVHTRVLSRLKIYQTMATVMALPPTAVLHSLGKLSTVDMYAMFGISSVACVMLYVMSWYFRRIVGMISICKENKMVRLSHLTFWGKRKDLYISPEDIIPLLDMSESSKKVYVLVKTYSSDETFILFLRFHRIFDRDQLEGIFGPLE
ncbi:uncharacterized protein LOC121378701 [Gigantopelta aegis]|uniref:uncharacterized protein LOC121378701 n=1 Tax=Gigantopelta aegis TaxID=1735272 RepID=UPI001B88A848|nr:uncharacterized protein LOC121378701 [Gigantopelta aegis]